MSNGFELLAPRGLLLLGLIAPLVILYVLKVRRTRKVVASTWLWQSAHRELSARSPFQRLVAQVPLVLEILAIMLFSLALARPATRGRAFVGDHVAVVVDTSASMAAVVPGATPSTRIDVAKQRAKALLGSLVPGSDALVFEAGREARLVAPLDRDLVRVGGAIDRIAVNDVEGDLGQAVALAVDRLRPLGGSRRVVVFTDGALAHPESLGSAALPVDVVLVGEPVDNAAIVRVDVRTGNDPTTHREEVQGFLVVANFGKTARDLYVTMHGEAADDVLASRRILVQPGERQPVVLTFRPSPGDYRRGLVFDVSPHDALAVDDVAFGRVPSGEKLPVFVASGGGSPWLERALAADPMVDLRTGRVGDLHPGAVAPDALVVVDGACPDSIPGADVLVVHPPAGVCFGATIGEPLAQPPITSWENADARLRFLTLDDVHVSAANRITGRSSGQELVRTDRGAIAVDASTPSRAVTLLGFDVGESDWPLKASFVLFVRNVLEQARAHRAHGVTGPARTGEPIRVAVPLSAEHVEAFGPSGKPVDVVVRGGLAIVASASRAGLYHVSWRGPEAGMVVVAANLTSAAESDLGRRFEPGTTNVTVTSAGAEPRAHVEWSWLAALAALGLVVADVAYATRRPRPPTQGAVPRVPERRAR